MLECRLGRHQPVLASRGDELKEASVRTAVDKGQKNKNLDFRIGQ